MKLVFDIETNGLLNDVTKIFCIVAEDIETNKVYSFKPEEVEEGIDLLSKATLLIGHNIQGFDIPVIEKIYNTEIKAEVYDTCLLYTSPSPRDGSISRMPSSA